MRCLQFRRDSFFFSQKMFVNEAKNQRQRFSFENKFKCLLMNSIGVFVFVTTFRWQFTREKKRKIAKRKSLIGETVLSQGTKMPRQRFQILDHQHPTNLNLVYTQRECRPRVSAAASWRCQRLLAKCHSLERLPSYWKTSVEKRKQVAMNISTNLSFEFHPRIFSPSRFTGNIIFHLSQWNELCLVRPWSFFASEREGERTTHQKQKKPSVSNNNLLCVI